LASDTRAIFAPTSEPAPFGAGFLFRSSKRVKTTPDLAINKHREISEITK
jgi:hypothetical protein